MRDAEKGPLVVEMVKRRVIAKIDRKVGPEETLVVIRSPDLAMPGRLLHLCPKAQPPCLERRLGKRSADDVTLGEVTAEGPESF